MAVHLTEKSELVMQTLHRPLRAAEYLQASMSSQLAAATAEYFSASQSTQFETSAFLGVAPYLMASFS